MGTIEWGSDRGGTCRGEPPTKITWTTPEGFTTAAEEGGAARGELGPRGGTSKSNERAWANEPLQVGGPPQAEGLRCKAGARAGRLAR